MATDKSIHNFDTGTLTDSSLFVMSYPSVGTTRATGNISAGELGNGLCGDIDFNALNTSNKTVFGAINELLTASTNTGSIISDTLTAGSTSITLTDAKIHTDSWIEFWTSAFGVNPTSSIVSEGSVTLTFEAQQSNVVVGVLIRGVASGGGDGTKTTVLTDGYVSHNGAYTTATFDEDVSDYDFLVLSFNDNGTDYINNFALAVNQIGQNGFDFAVQIVGPVSMHITKTTIQATQYSGSWREIKCTVVAWKENGA